MFKKETWKKKHSESFLHMRACDSFLAKQKAEEDIPIFKSLWKWGARVMRNKEKMLHENKYSYFIAKEELPFTKFPKLLDLQRKNGL